jgi:arylformamidase
MSAAPSALWPKYWDQDELDKQYNPRGTVPDLTPHLVEYRARTDAAKQRLTCHIGLAYGGTEPERLDVYPAGPGAPVFMFIHGGYWRALDAADSGFMAEAMVAHGICVVAVNYTLAPEASLDEIVRQCRAALAWVHAHIAEYGGDPARIHVSGSSAGGHLSAMLAAKSAPGAEFVHSVTLLSGLYDLTLLPQTHINGWIKLDAESALRNSPLYLLPREGLPIIGTYAPNETAEFKRQSEVYFAACTTIGCKVQTVAVPNTNHFDIVLALADAGSPLSLAVRAVIG